MPQKAKEQAPQKCGQCPLRQNGSVFQIMNCDIYQDWTSEKMPLCGNQLKKSAGNPNHYTDGNGDDTGLQIGAQRHTSPNEFLSQTDHARGSSI